MDGQRLIAHLLRMVMRISGRRLFGGNGDRRTRQAMRALRTARRVGRM